jgi:hypothetical protein
MLLLQIVTPLWWWIMVVPFVFGVVRAKSGRHAILLGVLGGSILWFASSTYYYLAGSQIIARRVAAMMGLGSPVLLIIVTTILAFIAGGIAASAGYSIRKLLPKSR